MRLPQYERAAWIDSARLALQSASAAALSWFSVSLLDQPHASWAVISALLVGQASVDGTLAALRGRLAGTLLGAGVGLAAVLALPGEDLTVLRLLLAAALVSAIAGLRPSLRYAAVVVAIITLDPGQDPLQDAFDRTIAIGIGGLAGAACALALWPQSARSRALRAARRALDDCAALLDASLRAVLGEHVAMNPLHDRFLRHIGAAREQLVSMRRRHGERSALEKTVHAIERLWHALIVLDRITSTDAHWSPAAGTSLHGQLHDVRTEACAHVRGLAASLGSDRIPDDSALRAVLATAREQALRAAPDRQVDATALVFALGEIAANLGEIRACAGAEAGPPP